MKKKVDREGGRMEGERLKGSASIELIRYYYCLLETGSHYITQAALELILLPSLPSTHCYNWLPSLLDGILCLEGTIDVHGHQFSPVCNNMREIRSKSVLW